MTAFSISGDGFDEPLRRLRRRIGMGPAGGRWALSLGDPKGEDLLRRFECLGGVVLVSPGELERAAHLGGEVALSKNSVDLTLAMAARAEAVIVAGRRRSGGVVFYLVAPSPAAVGSLIQGFLRLRGIPDMPRAIP